MKPIWGILMDAFFVALLIWCSYTDLKRRTVSNLCIVILLCLGLAHTILVVLSGSTWWVYLAGMLLGIPFFIIWMKGGMGGGDLKLIMAIGLYFGPLNTLAAFILMIPILATFVIYLWIKIRSVKCQIPFAPVISFGATCIMFIRFLKVLQ